VEVKPIHIIAASVFAFVAIVAANIITEYRSNEAFRDKLASIDPKQVLAVRTQRIAEENMVPVETASDDDEN